MRDWPEVPVPEYRSAVFLDRDGTINVDTHYPHRKEDLCLIPGSLKALVRLSQLPAHIIVVANQAGIAKGLYGQSEMSSFNEELRLRVEKVGGRIDAFYFCPHFERKDLPPEVSPCGCSKPSSGMLLEAARDYRLDLSSSFIIGDRTSDVAAGERVGCISILVKTGKAGKEENALAVRPKHVADDLLEAANVVARYFEGQERVTHVRDTASGARVK